MTERSEPGAEIQPGDRFPDGLPDNADHTFDPTRTQVFVSGDGEGEYPIRGRGVPEVPGAVDGPFQLHQFIDRGGYGEVWEATQTSLDRIVALKRLREDLMLDGVDSRRRAEDFRREALTTAALEHPNIVPVYDAGKDLRGQPQFAMKLVRGKTWKERVEGDRELAPGEFLGRHLPILIDVAQAVAFAHSHGVMHRDIKPSQVLVGEFGEALLVDWGMAVCFDDGLWTGAGGGPRDAGSRNPEQQDASTCNSLATATCPAGTPSFMAPEQTDDTPDRLGPWTDVYLLGGTLYYLLTGTPPRSGVSAKAAFVLAGIGAIEPPRQRAGNRVIPADLERLAMQALAVEPKERPTAREFIAALQDHLSGAGKHRESMDLTRRVGEILPTAAGSYGMLSQCLSDLDRASGLWVANPEIEALREQALTRYATAAMTNGDLELARRQALLLADEKRRQALVGEITQRAAAHQRTARQRRLFFRVSLVLGAALLASGVKYTIDQQRARARLAEQRNIAVAARVQAEGFAAFMLEDLTPSLEALGRLDILDQVAKESIAYYASLPPDETGPGVLIRRSLALRTAGRVLRDQGQLEDARVALDRSLAVVRKLVEDQPGDPVSRAHLADRLLELGVLMGLTSDPDAAIEDYGRAAELYRALREQDPDSVEYRHGLAHCLHGIAFELWARAELDRSMAALDEAVTILEDLIDENPDDLDSTRLLVETYARVGGVQRDRGALEEAAAVGGRAVELGQELAAADPANTLNLSALSESASSLGFTLWQIGDLQGALEAYQTALSIDRQLGERDPTNQARRRELATSYSNVGEMLRDLGDPTGALESLRVGVAILEPLVAENPDHAEWRYALATADIELGNIYVSMGERRRAEAAWGDAVEQMEGIALERGDLYYLDTYARALLLLGRIDEARPVAAILVSKGWKGTAFVELCRRSGLDIR
jgi:serine/threonine protein kinase